MVEQILKILLLLLFIVLPDSSGRVCVDLSKTPADFTTETALMENLQKGVVLYRLWIGLEIFEADDESKYLITNKPLIEGTAFTLGGGLRGQVGVSFECGYM